MKNIEFYLIDEYNRTKEDLILSTCETYGNKVVLIIDNKYYFFNKKGKLKKHKNPKSVWCVLYQSENMDIDSKCLQYFCLAVSDTDAIRIAMKNTEFISNLNMPIFNKKYFRTYKTNGTVPNENLNKVIFHRI